MHLLEQLQSALGNTYTIERELGGGGMSRVFVAEEITLSRKVVIKVLSPDLAEAMSSDRFRREIALAARLQHPHIVPLYAASVVDGLPYYTMPFVEGRSLKDELDKGELPITHALAILQDVASALAHAHSKGVIHRDIKPGNVLLAESAASVTDFGIAKALNESVQKSHALTGTGVSLGTPAYMAPEQAAADPQSDHRADIYSFGVLAYEMLCGHTPFAGRTPQQTIAANAIEEPPRLSLKRRTIPPGLETLVHNCLAKSPADRPQTVTDLIHSLQHSDTVKPARRGPRTAVVAVAAAAALLLVAAGIVWQYNAAKAAFRPGFISVAPFVNMTGKAELDGYGPYVSTVVSDALWRLKDMKPIQVSTTLDAWDRVTKTAGSKDKWREFARRTKSRHVILGSFSMRPGTDTVLIRTEIWDALRGETLPGAMPEVPVALAHHVDGATTVGRNAFEKIRHALNRAINGLITLPPKDPVAHDLFLGGVIRFVADQPEASIDLFSQSIQHDSTFVISYAYMMHALIDLGHWKSADSCMVILDRMAKRYGSPVEQEIARAMDAAVRGRWEEESRSWEWLTANDPAFVGVYRRGVTALAASRPRDAVAIFRSTEKDVEAGWPSYWLFRAVAHHVLAEHRAEEDVIQLGDSLEKNVRELIDAKAAVYGARRNVAALDALLESVAASWDTSSRITPLEIALTGAAELEAHGHQADADRIRKSGGAWTFDPAARRMRAQKAGGLAIAQLMFHTNNPDSARAVLVPLSNTAEDPGSHPDSLRSEALGWLGVIAVAENDTAEALRIVDLLATDDHRHTHGQRHYAKARIQAMLGKKDDAVQSIKDALRAGMRFGIDIHRDLAFAGLREYARFKQILRPQG